MRIGVSSAVLYPELAEKAVKKLVDYGFDTFEFFYNCDEEITPSFVEKINGLRGNAEVISIHPYTAFAEGVFFFSEYRRRTEEAVKKYKNSFAMARELGAEFFSFHGDRVFGNNSLSEENVEILIKLSEMAKEEGITLCLENVSWCKSSKLDYIKAVAEKVKNIGFTLDLKQARRAGVPYEEYIASMGSRILNIHASDYDDECDCVLPGKGKFDFGKFRKDIEGVNYSGDIIIEVYSDCFKDVSEIVEAKKFLESILS